MLSSCRIAAHVVREGAQRETEFDSFHRSRQQASMSVYWFPLGAGSGYRSNISRPTERGC